MSFSVKHNTVLKRAEEGMNLWQICQQPGTPSYSAMMGKLNRNTDGFADAYVEAVKRSGLSDGRI